jgi:hypothetical protein
MKTSRLILLAIASISLLVNCSRSVGGMASDYDAKDNDPSLRVVAEKGVPIIAAVEKFKRDCGEYPATLDSILKGLRPDEVEEAKLWYYDRFDHGYTLARRLGWDPILEYDVTETAKKWIFNPGDGRDEIPIVFTGLTSN